MTLVTIARAWHFARHIRPHQLFSRVRLTLKRKILARIAPKLKVRPRTLSSVSLSNKRLQGYLPTRSNSLRADGDGFQLTFLNRTRHYRLPFDWSERELEKGTRLWKLNLHYMEFLEGADNASFKAIVEDWIRNNPPYKPAYWTDNWNSYSLSIRVVVWMQQWERRNLPNDIHFTETFKQSLIKQLSFLERNIEFDIYGNHLLKNIKALLWAGQFFEGKDAARWHRRGKRLLARELKEQFLPDGMHYERSPAYHCQVFADLLDCWAVIGEDGIGLEPVIHKAAEALAATTHPDGLPSLFNDSGLHMAYTPTDLLDAYEKVFNRRPTTPAAFALPNAGYYGFRSERVYLLADCGDIGPDFLVAHGHGDTLAFEMTVDGKRFIVDQGVFEYDPGEKRDISRATASHNTVEINGQSQSDFFGSFRVGRRAHAQCLRYEPRDNGFTLLGTHDGYNHLKGRPRHIRQFDVSEAGVRILDEVSASRPHPSRAFLLLGPNVSIALREGGADLSDGDTTLRLAASAPFVIEDAVWFPDFGVEKPTKRLVFDYGSSPAHHDISLILQS